MAGLDEVGCGPLAGTLVAAAVVLPAGASWPWLEDVRDSKQLAAKRRELLDDSIRNDALAVGVGVVGPVHFDAIGVGEARRVAMERAIAKLTVRPQHLLIDAFELPDVHVPQTAVVHGDALCISIACASIVAKVARDRHIVSLERRYPGYCFAQNKGYGVPAHLEALSRLGPTPIHRHSFRPVRGTSCRCARCSA